MPGSVDPAVEAPVPWVIADVQEFTDELVDLSEARRVDQFVAIARDAGLPAKFIAQLEKDSAYPVTSKKGLKRALAATAVKWLNRTGVSAKNKEEAALLFCAVAIRLQGWRMKKALLATIDSDREARERAAAAAAKAGTAGA